MTADPVAVAVRVAGILDQLGVRWLLGGSLASVAFGEPRATLDVDLVVDLGADQVEAFVRALEPEFFVDASFAADEVQRRGSFQMVHRASMIRVDVFVPEWVGLHAWQWERRQQLQLGDAGSAPLNVTSAEGIVLQKLVWFREGGEVSDRQWRDVLGVLKNQRDRLNFVEMRACAATCGVSDLLDKACSQAGIGPDGADDV